MARSPTGRRRCTSAPLTVGGGVGTVVVEVNGDRVATPAQRRLRLRRQLRLSTRFRPCDDFTRDCAQHREAALARRTERRCGSASADVPRARRNTPCEQRSVSSTTAVRTRAAPAGQARVDQRRARGPAERQAERGALGALERRHRPARPAQRKCRRRCRAASVCVYETVDEPAGIEQLVQVAKSSSSGAFGVEIPGGPTRSFRVAYRFGGRQIETPSLHLDSSVLPSLGLVEVQAPQRQGGPLPRPYPGVPTTAGAA